MPVKAKHRKQPHDVTYLMKLSRVYEELCPELARFLMHEAHAIKENKSAEGDATHGKDGGLVPVLYQCPYCFQRFRAGNHRVRLRPKRRPAARVQGVLRREARGKRLSLAQRELLRRFRSSASKLMATCHTCNKTSRYNGVNRDFTMALSRTRGGPGRGSGGGKLKSPPASVNRSHPGTPKSAGKERTPASKTPSKMKTPSKSPRPLSSSTPGSGSTASSSSSPKSAGSVKKWVVRGLSKILNRDQKTDSKRGTLKDFLSSL